MNLRTIIPTRWALLIGLVVLLAVPTVFMAGEAPNGRDDSAHLDRRGEAPKGKIRRPLADPPMKDLRLKNDDEPTEARIERTLGNPTEVNFIETSLEDALNLLSNYHNVNIWLDRKALLDAEIAVDQPVTLKVTAARFESVLNLLVEPLDLEWLIQDEVLKITTRDKAALLSETRTFDVQNLIDAGHSPDELIEAIVRCIAPASWNDEGGQGAISHSGGMLVCRQTQRIHSEIALVLAELDEQAEARLEEARHDANALITLKAYPTRDYPAEELAKALPRLIATDTWTKPEVGIESVKGAILVRQVPHVHQQIEKLLRQMSITPETAAAPAALIAPGS